MFGLFRKSEPADVTVNRAGLDAAAEVAAEGPAHRIQTRSHAECVRIVRNLYNIWNVYQYQNGVTVRMYYSPARTRDMHGDPLESPESEHILYCIDIKRSSWDHIMRISAEMNVEAELRKQ